MLARSFFSANLKGEITFMIYSFLPICIRPTLRRKKVLLSIDKGGILTEMSLAKVTLISLKGDILTEVPQLEMYLFAIMHRSVIKIKSIHAVYEKTIIY